MKYMYVYIYLKMYIYIYIKQAEFYIHRFICCKEDIFNNFILYY